MDFWIMAEDIVFKPPLLKYVHTQGWNRQLEGAKRYTRSIYQRSEQKIQNKKKKKKKEKKRQCYAKANDEVQKWLIHKVVYNY